MSYGFDTVCLQRNSVRNGSKLEQLHIQLIFNRNLQNCAEAIKDSKVNQQTFLCPVSPLRENDYSDTFTSAKTTAVHCGRTAAELTQ